MEETKKVFWLSVAEYDFSGNCHQVEFKESMLCSTVKDAICGWLEKNFFQRMLMELGEYFNLYVTETNPFENDIPDSEWQRYEIEVIKTPSFVARKSRSE